MSLPADLDTMCDEPGATAVTALMAGLTTGHARIDDHHCACGAPWHTRGRPHSFIAGLELLVERGYLPADSARIAEQLTDNWTGSLNELSEAITGILT